MQTYSILREFADSWFLIAMFAFFLGTCLFAFWPGARSAREDAANIPFRDAENMTCTKDCASCSCNLDVTEGQSNE